MVQWYPYTNTTYSRLEVVNEHRGMVSSTKRLSLSNDLSDCHKRLAKLGILPDGKSQPVTRPAVWKTNPRQTLDCQQMQIDIICTCTSGVIIFETFYLFIDNIWNERQQRVYFQEMENGSL